MADNYLVLARKWRPQRFEDLLGQQHVARTLANAIRTGRVAHGFLFAGVRGVGKTSAARILAKALTCRGGPTPEPCGTCDACVSVTGGHATDVQEIDGASNNSVEDIRRLRENVAYQPASLRFKIYIIDEVHMLSNNAFNALLKTLEEPPAHVKFIFATTEAHKIPTTILSRCQRYEFRRIGTRQIAARLEQILAEEQIRLEPAAVHVLADEAGGSMRDALSLLDQVLAAFPQGATAQELTWLLGVTPQALLARTAAAIVARDTRAALEAVRDADDAGHNLQQFAGSFLRYLRDLLVLASCPDARGLTDLGEAEEAAARDIVGRTTVPHLHRLFALASRLVDDLARSPLPRVHADVAVARMASADLVVPVADLLARLERLPAARGADAGSFAGRNAAPPDAPPPPPGGPAARPFPRAAAAAPARPAEADDVPPPDDDAPPDEVPPPDDAAWRDEGASGRAADRSSGGAGERPGGRAVGQASGRAAERPGESAGADERGSELAAHGSRLTAPPDRAQEVGGDAPEVPPEMWGSIVADVGRTEHALGGLLSQAVPTALSAKLVRLAFPEGSTAADMLRQPRKADALAAALERALCTRPRVEIDDASSDAVRAIAQRAAAEHAAREEARRRLLDHPAVREATRAFGGARVVDVKTEAAERTKGGERR
ncbi:MAG: DNA polymerase III subunit gamma/tau [Deltaproteobacteria bacterium]|nr:DNA polymerase III subunit gamma/tau [Deltaproteobacteria bacterium]